MDGREATTVAGLAAFAGLPAALVATSTRAEDVCARARTTRSASAASLSAIGGDMVRARVTCARASRTPRKRSPCDLAGHRGRETWDPFDPFDSFGLVRDDWPNLPVCEPKLRCRFKAENDEDLVGCCPRTARIYQKVGIGQSGASVEPASELFPGEARSRRAACCTRSRVPGRRGGPDTRRWVVSGAMVGILRTPDSRGGGPSPYQEAPASARTYDWRRIDHTVRAIPTRSDFIRPRRRVRAVLPHKRRAIRGARPPIQHNFPTRFRPTARRAD